MPSLADLFDLPSIGIGDTPLTPPPTDMPAMAEMGKKEGNVCNDTLIVIGNDLVATASDIADVSADFIGGGLALAFIGGVSFQPEVASVGLAVAETGGVLGVGAALYQTAGGMLQGLGGGGFDNAVNGVASLFAGAFIKRFFAFPGIPSSAFERRLANRLEKSTIVIGGTADVFANIASMAPRPATCKTAAP